MMGVLLQMNDFIGGEFKRSSICLLFSLQLLSDNSRSMYSITWLRLNLKASSVLKTTIFMQVSFRNYAVKGNGIGHLGYKYI